jgi:uncharacterized membrane protein YesL
MNQLSAPLKVIAQAVVDWWDGVFTLAIIGVVWIFCWITVLLGPPATFGLYYVANRLAHGENVGVRGFIDGGRRFFLMSWMWALLNVMAVIALGVNALFYGQIDAVWALGLQVFVLGLGLLWLSIQFYTLPYMMEQDQKQLRLALRNGLITTLAAPVYTLMLLSLSAVLVVLSFVLVFPLIMGAPGLIAALGNHAVLERLEAFEVQQRDGS